MIWPRIGVFAIFAVVGPPAGALLVSAAVVAASMAEEPAPLMVVMLPLMALMGSLYSYFIAGVPALLTGLVAAWSSPHVKRDWLWVLLSVAAGAAFTAGWMALDGAPRGDSALQEGMGFLPAIGAGAALACALVARTFRPKPR